jgi:MoxR-like ATPase
MRGVFLRLGYRISCDANAVTGALICAALIGRRVFLFAVIALAIAKFVARRHHRNVFPAQRQPAEEARPEHRPRRMADAEFRPLPGFECPAIPDVSALRDALRSVLVGQSGVIEALMLSLIADGHVLFEGAPSLAKTLACRTLARTVNGTFARIQCTADLMPADILGCEIFDPRDLSFRTRLGPLFANVVLLDEINRAPARTQAALFEALHERQVTIGGQTYALPDPFVVLATMNETDPDGIFPIPAAQLDRFLLKVLLDFPSPSEELEILERFGSGGFRQPQFSLDLDRIRSWRGAARTIYCAPAVKGYIVDLVCATRKSDGNDALERGAGPRACLALLRRPGKGGAGRPELRLAGRCSRHRLRGASSSRCLSARLSSKTRRERTARARARRVGAAPMNAIRRALLQRRGLLPRRGDWAAPREYRSDEDAREIDWRATARSGSLQVRERDRDVPVTWSAIVDRSQSMHVGRHRTLYASAFEAVQLWRGFLAPYDQWVDVAQTTGAFSLASALEVALQQLPAAAALLVISDVYELGPMTSTLMQTAARRFDCTALIARDPWFEEFPLRGFVRIVDVESSGGRDFYVGPQERARYRNAAIACETHVRRVLRAAGWRVAVLEERDAVAAMLRAFDLA